MSFVKCRSVNAKVFTFLFSDMAMLGQELMLCKADDLDLINVMISPMQVFRVSKKHGWFCASHLLSFHPIHMFRAMQASVDSFSSCSSFCLLFRAATSRVVREQMQSCCSMSSSVQRISTSFHKCSSPHWTPGLHT